MRKSEQGFAHVFVLLVAVLLVAGSGYVVYVHQQNNSTGASTDTAQTRNTSGTLATPPNEPKTAAGSADAVDTLSASLVNSESSLNTQYTASDSASDGTVGTAANNLGGAYDANDY